MYDQFFFLNENNFWIRIIYIIFYYYSILSYFLIKKKISDVGDISIIIFHLYNVYTILLRNKKNYPKFKYYLKLKMPNYENSEEWYDIF